MCMRTKDAIFKIAEKDIICYKRGYPTVIGLGFSPIARGSFLYTLLNKTKIVKIDPCYNSYYKEYRIDEGYHSANTFVSLNNFSRNGDIGIFVIPKGTKYIDGFFDGNRYCPNRVSESLIFFGMNNKLTRWRLKKKYGKNCLETL